MLKTLVKFVRAWGDKTANVILLIAIFCALGLIVHQHSHQAAHAPYIAVDDALGNISVTMVEHGRNGFLASPLQGGADAPSRAHNQFNYGILPFIAVAGLDWLFGTSYAVHRGINPLCLIAIVLLAIVTFRSWNALWIAGLFAFIVTFYWWPSIWPMMRPDVVVALLAVCATASATWALKSNHLFAWLGVGFFAVSAVSSHQVAWAFVPWTFFIWGMGWILLRLERKQHTTIPIKELVWGLVGGVLAISIYLIGIGFRIDELVELLLAYKKMVGDRHGEKREFYDLLQNHWTAIWAINPLHRLKWVLSSVSLLGFMITIYHLVIRSTVVRQIVALVFPPVTAWIAYYLSLGFYPNFHSGYYILPQALVIWSACVSLLVFFLTVKHRIPLEPRYIQQLLSITIVGMLVVFIAIAKPTYWSRMARNMVSFSEYESRVFETIPYGARVFGAVQYGLDSGNRVNLIRFPEGVQALLYYKPSLRFELAPDHLVIYEMLQRNLFDFLTLRTMKSRSDSGAIWKLQSFILPETYNLASIVDAPPYGQTLVYTKNHTLEPQVAVHDIGSKIWSRQLTKISATNIRYNAAPVRIRYYTNNKEYKTVIADATATIDLPKGDYFVKISLSRSTNVSGGFLIGSSRKELEHRPGDLNFIQGVSPYFRKHRIAYTLIRHPGGKMYISQLDGRANGGFEIISIQKVASLKYVEKELPPPSSWYVSSKTGKVFANSHGGVVYEGDNTDFGYQLISSPIPVLKNTKVEVNLSLFTKSGNIALGILTGDQKKWLVSPQRTTTASTNTGDNETIVLVIANNNRKKKDEKRHEKTSFHFSGGVMRTTGNTAPHKGNLYVDDLVRCMPKVREKTGKDCEKDVRG